MKTAHDPARENFEFQKIIAAVGAVLMIGKFLAYFLTNSVSILTDALESIVNVIAGIIGLYALWLSSLPADKSHPYGHGKVELISSSVEGSLIFVAGITILFQSYRHLMNPQEIGSLDIGLVIIAIAAAANFVMGYTAIRKGRKNGSIALESSGRHLCTDTYDSIGIIVGLIAVYIGYSLGYDVWWLDPAIAVLFGMFIMISGMKVLYKSMNGIMDRADGELLEQVIGCIVCVRVPEMIDVHHLRVLRYGVEVHLDMHMTVPEWLTVKETNVITDNIRRELYKEFGDCLDMTIMAGSCKKSQCRNCPVECPDRRYEFISRRQLSVEAAIRPRPEIPSRRASVRKWDDRSPGASLLNHSDDAECMLGFGSKNKNVPAVLKKAGLAGWFGGLSDKDKIRVTRYADGADASSSAACILSLIRLAAEDENQSFVLFLADSAKDLKMTDAGRFDINEAVIVAKFDTGDYDGCLESCDIGLSMLEDSDVSEHVRLPDGRYPERLECRNYKINVLAGANGDFEGAEKALDDFAAAGLISGEEADCRKQSIRTYKMQRTFEAIFTLDVQANASKQRSPGYLPVNVHRRFLEGMRSLDRPQDGGGVPSTDDELQTPSVFDGYFSDLPRERMRPLGGHPCAPYGMITERSAVSGIDRFHRLVHSIHDRFQMTLGHIDPDPEDLVLRIDRSFRLPGHRPTSL